MPSRRSASRFRRKSRSKRRQYRAADEPKPESEHSVEEISLESINEKLVRELNYLRVKIDYTTDRLDEEIKQLKRIKADKESIEKELGSVRERVTQLEKKHKKWFKKSPMNLIR